MSFKEVQKRKALTSNVLQLQVDKFISNRNNKIIMPSKPIKAELNTNGFIEVLNGAIKSTGTESLESSIPKDADLSIKQNGGFSFFVWLYIFKINSKTKKSVGKDEEREKHEAKNVYYIFRKGSSVDEFTPTLGIIDNSKHLIIELSTSTIKKTFLLANKTMEQCHLYSIGVTFHINYDDNSTEVSIYIDGKLDTQSKISGEPLHNQGNVFFGKIDYSSRGFKGVVADLMIMPSVLNDNDINKAHLDGLKNLSDSNGEKLDMKSIFEDIFKKKRLINKYAFYTNKTKYEIENLCLSNSKMLEVVKNYDEEEIKNDNRQMPKPINKRHQKMIEEMKKFLKNEDNRILCTKIDMNSQLIYTCFYLANEGEDLLEVERVLNIFETLQEVLLFEVKENFIVPLSIILYAFEKKNYIKTKKFFINLQKSLDEFEQKEKEEEAENAKYEKKTKNKKIDFLNLKKIREKEMLKFNSLLRRQNDTRNNPLPPIKTRGFGNCITEHENLLLKTQNLRDCIEADNEQNLKNFHSMFRIKDLYEVPKNLPGEDSTFPSVKLIKSESSSTTSFFVKNKKSNNQSKMSFVREDDQQKPIQTSQNDNNNSINTINSILKNTETNGKTKTTKKKIKKLNINDEEIENNKKIHDMLLDLLNEEEAKIKTPEIGSNTGPEKAELMEKDIFKQREEIRKRKEELEKKRLEEERLKNKKEEVYVEPPKKIQYSFDPKYPEDWTNGSFELVINHCHDCDKHIKSTRHYEYQFIDKFNEIGEEVKSKFPNSTIIGNLNEQEYYGNFDVYLRNTGLPSYEKDKYYIYRKNIKNKFPTKNEIIDKLICLVIMYGSSLNVEKAQIDPFKPDTLERLNITHEFPAELSEKAEKIKSERLKKNPEIKTDEERTKFFCTNNGCNKIFVQKENVKNACHYHPGVYQFGSYNGLWPECWSCCEGKWESKGCKVGQHNGILEEKRIMLCLNHGELNSKGFPDSVCGKWYTKRSIDGCKYHSGHIRNGQFTCCGQGPENPGCVEGSHNTAIYPDEKARLYFYPKTIHNPGIKSEKVSVSELIKRCFYFKEVVKYPDYKQLNEEKIKRLDKESDMFKQCLNIGCNKKFKEKHNTEKSCMCHSGRWDFGGTKFNLGFIEDEEIRREEELESQRVKKEIFENDINEKKKKKSKELRLMHVERCYGKWRPHWTCCGGKWDAKPCTPCRHRGPLLENLKNYYLPYRYPDIRFQFTFYKRVVSDSWAKYIEDFKYDEKKVRKICKEFIDKKGSLKIENIHELLNILKLKYVMEQEDPSYFLKYRDLCLRQETFKFLCNEGEQNIDIERFIKWWFSDYLTLYNIIHPPEKKVKNEKEKPKEEEEKNSQ